MKPPEDHPVAQTPDTPDAAPPDTPDAAPPDTPDAAPPDTPDAAPPDTPDAAPPDTPDAAPPDTPDAAPPDTPERAPAAGEPELPDEPAADARDLEDAQSMAQDSSSIDEEEPLRGRQGGKKAIALVLAAILVLAAALGYRVFSRPSANQDGSLGQSWGWARLPFPPIDPRYGHAAVWTGSEMIVWGGFSGVAAQSNLPGAGIRSDGAAFNLQDGRWELVPPAPLPHRPDIPAVWTGSNMIAWGGDPAQPAGGIAYDPGSKAWRPLPPSPLLARGGQSTVWTGSELIVWGGRVGAADNPAQQPELSSAGAAYNPQAGSWRDISPAPIAPRDGHSAVWTGREMIVWGGVGGAGSEAPAALADGAAFDPASNTWRALQPAPAALDGIAVWSGAEVFVWGSRLNTETGDPASPQTSRYVIESFGFNPSTGDWRKLPASSLTPRTDAGAVWSGERLVVWGGYSRNPAGSASAGPVRDGAAYDPSSNRWETIPDAPVKGRDTGFSMIPAEDALIVWGGKASERGGPGTTLADGAQLVRNQR